MREREVVTCLRVAWEGEKEMACRVESERLKDRVLTSVILYFLFTLLICL